MALPASGLALASTGETGSTCAGAAAAALASGCSCTPSMTTTGFASFTGWTSALPMNPIAVVTSRAIRVAPANLLNSYAFMSSCSDAGLETGRRVAVRRAPVQQISVNNAKESLRFRPPARRYIPVGDAPDDLTRSSTCAGVAAMSGTPSRPLVVIPSRLAATRLPDKPLADICGVPMIVQVWRRAVEANVGPVLVAAAEAPIVDAVRQAGGEATLTRPDHLSRSDRILEAGERLDPP